MRHRDVHVGNFFLGDKEGGPEFTSGDEEVLVLFASQAATAIANARSHRDERRARADLEALEHQRAEFLSMVSHELRTPLSAIKSSATAVLGASRSSDQAETRQFFRVIDEQADQMLGLIGDLLDQGRIEMGTLSVSLEPAEVASLVDHARNTFLTGGSGHALTIDLPEDLPRVMADPGRTVQILNNLFSNASRHSPESSPIRVAAARDGLHVAVSVSDRGRGGHRTGCRTCSASTAARRPARGSAGRGAPASGCRYTRGWWRRTAAASGRRAKGRGAVPGSPFTLPVDAGRAVKYDSLLRQAWGKRERGSAAPKLVRAIIKGLRSKLGDDAAKPAYVRNVRGVGYRMPSPAER